MKSESVLEAFSFLGAASILLLFLMPFCSWLIEIFPAFCSGQKSLPLHLSYKRAFAFLRETCRAGLDLKEGVCCFFLLLSLLSLPGLSLWDSLPQRAMIGFLSDPALIGVSLLLVRLYLVPSEAFFVSVGGGFVLLWMYVLLLLIAPQIHDLSQLAQSHNASLNGALACSMLALMLTVPVPRVSDLVQRPVTMNDFSHYVRAQGERKEGILIFFQGFWIIFLSDLMVLPEHYDSSVGTIGGFLGRVVIVIVVCTVCHLTRLERNLRSIALLSGLGLLFALAGRFAS